MLVSVEEIARQFQIPLPDSGSELETLLIDFIEEATDAVKLYLNTTFLEPYTGSIDVQGNQGQTLELGTYAISVSSITYSDGTEVDSELYALSPFNPIRRNADNSPIYTGVFNLNNSWVNENTIYTVEGVFGVKDSQTPRTLRKAIRNMAQFYSDSNKLNAFIQSQSGAALNTLFDTSVEVPPFIKELLTPWRIIGV